MSDVEARDPTGGLRFVEDTQGVAWTIWEVTPQLTRTPAMSSLPPIAESLKNGWLTFQSPTDRRRLAPVPPGWQSMSSDALCQLLRESEPVRPLRARRVE